MIRDYINEVNKLKKQLREAESIEYNEDVVDDIRKRLELKVRDFQKERNNLTFNNYEFKITKEDIKKAVEQKAGVKIREQDLKVGKDAAEEELSRLSNLKNILAAKVIGQMDATNTIAEAVIRSKIGFRNSKRPIGVFLFLGTSGVGKTETAKVLSEELTGSVDDLIRLDMSEYQQEHEVAKLIGAPPGYVGFRSGGILTRAVKNNPKSVVLLDEIERAHTRIYDLMLQVFDDGILTDGMGERVDFSNTIIILTSNLGSNLIRKEKKVGFTRDGMEQIIREKTTKAIQNFFRPELLNRIDKIVTFKPFTEESIFKITRLLLEKEVDIIKKSGYELKFKEDAVKFLVKTTHDSENGARAIRRGITNLIETPLSELIVNKFINKGDKVVVDSDGFKLLFEVVS